MDASFVGGLRTALMPGRRGETEQPKTVHMLAPNRESFDLGEIKIVGVDREGHASNDRWPGMFGRGMCLIQFPEAYTSGRVPSDVIERMYAHTAANTSAHPIGSFERLLEYVELHGRIERVHEFMRIFAPAIESVPAGSVMNWQSFFFESAMRTHAPQLRAKDVKQIFHLHEAAPDSLSRSVWGRNVLEAFAAMDSVYVHTDTFVRRIERQLDELGMRVPKVKRFDLGIDTTRIERCLETVNRGNYREVIAGFNQLSPSQRDFIDESFRRQDRFMTRSPDQTHDFICVDRLTDPVKGGAALLDGVRVFLEGRREAGETAQQIRERYRFFFLGAGPAECPVQDPLNLNERYAEIVAERMAQLKKDFPGVVWSCESIGDPQWTVIPQLMRGKHGVTGAVTEGLNLAVMEILCSNVGLPCSLVVGQGAGFAMRIRDEQGLGSLALFPKPGDALDFARSFEKLVLARKDNYQAIAERSHRLFTEAVLPRRDWIAVEE